MRLLLDSHVLLWWAEATPLARPVIAETGSIGCLSLKHAAGA